MRQDVKTDASDDGQKRLQLLVHHLVDGLGEHRVLDHLVRGLKVRGPRSGCTRSFHPALTSTSRSTQAQDKKKARSY